MNPNSPIRNPQSASLRVRLRNWVITDTRGVAIVGAILLAVFWIGMMTTLTTTHNSITALAPQPAEPTAEPTRTQPGGTQPAPIPPLTTPSDYPSTPFGITAEPTKPKATTEDDGPTPADETAAQTAAERFATTWLEAPGFPSQTAWLAKLKPVTSPTFLKRLAVAQRTTVPKTELKGVAASLTGGRMCAYFLTTGGNRYNLSMTRSSTSMKWVVDTLTTP